MMKTKMIKKSRRLMLFIALIFVLQMAKGQEKDSILTLQSCVKLCIENNNKLKQAELELLKSKYKYKESVSYGLPQIKAYGSLDDFFSIPVTMIPGEIIGAPGTMFPAKMGTKYNSTAGVELGQMLFNQTYFTSLQLFKKTCEITDLSLQKSKEDMAYNIAQIYFMIQITALQLELQDSNLVALKKISKYINQQYQNGLIKKMESDRILVAVGNLEAEKANFVSIKNQQMNMLKYLMGINLNRQIILSENLEAFDNYLGLSDTSFSQHSDLLIMNKRKDLAMLNIKLSKSEYLPTLTGYASYSLQAPCDEFDMLKKKKNWYETSLVGVKLSIPIFEGFRIKNKVEQNKIELNQTIMGLEDLKNELNTNYMNAIQKQNTNKITVLKQQDNMNLAENIFILVNDQYIQGLKSLTDVLNAQSEYNTARLLWFNAVLQLKLSELEILKLNGGIQTLFLK